jgi:hypothetical protein
VARRRAQLPVRGGRPSGAVHACRQQDRLRQYS